MKPPEAEEEQSHDPPVPVWALHASRQYTSTRTNDIMLYLRAHRE